MQQHCSEYNDSCSNIVYQTVDVGLPIALTPSVDVGKIKIKCYGEPQLEFCQSEGGSLSFKVTQTITYKIPIEYSVESNTGEVLSKIKKNGCSQVASNKHFPIL